MGWASASTIMNIVIDNVKLHVPNDAARRGIYQPIYDALTDEDWDTVDESLGKDHVFDQIATEDGWGDDWEDEE